MPTFIYVYGLIPSPELELTALPSFVGMDGANHAYALPLGEITAVVCELDDAEYGEEALQERMNHDMAWLQEKAMHHHETLLMLNSRYTLIPMKLFTIHKSQASLEHKVDNAREPITALFAKLRDREEWNVKIFCNDAALRERVKLQDPVIAAKQQEISGLSPGRQFFEKKKIEKWIDRQLEEYKNQTCSELHDQFSRYAQAETVKRNWSKEATGRQENMSWNSVYLLPSNMVERFLSEIQAKKAAYEDQGWTIEASGPWPAYHFVALSEQSEPVA
ncbi:GvpL/GvpF family gas vesicle protein [Paenibacillus sp. 1P07SE]|uniref:GvpL/GvpF family gas vesicle protein n=1 Tax=Paenibacillus sp. 1P07SE TaxID=3132209 RepID=UPI0039A5CAFB